MTLEHQVETSTNINVEALIFRLKGKFSRWTSKQ